MNDYVECDSFLRSFNRVIVEQAFNVWNINVEQRKKLQITLNNTLQNTEKMSLKLNYSVLLMFYGLGCDALDVHFWPILETYLNVLASFDEIIPRKRSIQFTTDICRVRSALLVSINSM